LGHIGSKNSRKQKCGQVEELVNGKQIRREGPGLFVPKKTEGGPQNGGDGPPEKTKQKVLRGVRSDVAGGG